ncbi:unnamed protein product [Parnassius apollo]|uniref:(apollo) hypothetical protein n=1 Tax=Parnassius apollo TaxID=110799 RepID=A0A8S3YCE9_PARAO|nr:unnamed protein product [Parnassius apollo]
MQTVRQQIPDKTGQSSRPPQNVRFANLDTTDMGESCELSTMNETTSPTYQSTNPTNPFLSGQLQAEDSFTSYQNTYPQQDGAPRTQSMQSVDFYASSEEGGFEEGGGKPGAKINEYQAAWNVTNAIQGMFVVSLPFAVLQGGYWAIAAMIGIAHICCYTGKILVECLYEDDPVSGQRVRVRDSYVSIAKECFGRKYGARIVNMAQIIELLMTCILYVVVCGDLMIGTFPDGSIDTRSWMMLTGIFLLPLGFLKSLKSVSMLSFWCTMSHLIINAIVLGYCVLYIGDWGWSKVKWSLDFENFPISLGVIVFSYTSQIFLPTLEGNMEDRSKFEWMLNWSHIAAAAFKSIFGYLCFLTFQNDTQQVITNNLHSAGFKGLVNFFLVTKAVLSYPLPYYAACDLLERALFRGKPKTLFPTIYALDGSSRTRQAAPAAGGVRRMRWTRDMNANTLRAYYRAKGEETAGISYRTRMHCFFAELEPPIPSRNKTWQTESGTSCARKYLMIPSSNNYDVRPFPHRMNWRPDQLPRVEAAMDLPIVVDSDDDEMVSHELEQMRSILEEAILKTRSMPLENRPRLPRIPLSKRNRAVVRALNPILVTYLEARRDLCETDSVLFGAAVATCRIIGAKLPMSGRATKQSSAIPAWRKRIEDRIAKARALIGRLTSFRSGNNRPRVVRSVRMAFAGTNIS